VLLTADATTIDGEITIVAMRISQPGWTGMLRRNGPELLEWLSDRDALVVSCNALATALRTLLLTRISTGEDARDVWMATPAVLSRCNEQSTYEMHGAPCAYAWLHLLDRYTRTWLALEHLVAAGCLPLGREGVRVLDVGTGPGPAAFATHDFYVALTTFGQERGLPQFNQSPTIACVEFDPGTNELRHHLSDILFAHTNPRETVGGALYNAVSDFREIAPAEERARLERRLRWERDEYFNEIRNQWDSDPRYSLAEANHIAQSLHRYRLIIFSNFLTTVGATRSFEPNLINVLSDAHPGSVILVLGGKGEPYPAIYGYVDALASGSGFQLVLANQPVSSAESAVADTVFAEGVAFYNHLQRLAPDNSEETKLVRSHFTSKRAPASASYVRAYRKY
jgi:hypothetical protein